MWWLPILVQSHLEREAEERARADQLAAEERARADQRAAEARAAAEVARQEAAQTAAGLDDLRRARADIIRQIDALSEKNAEKKRLLRLRTQK